MTADDLFVELELSCPETSLFGTNDLFIYDIYIFIFIIMTALTSYLSKVSSRINIQLIGFVVPSILSCLLAYMITGSILSSLV